MIYNAPSIYKQGGGGGDYKDGGQLVDADFIEVENNTISSYDNVSRDPVNFYFDVKPGEVINSVIELTTAVNATINVYVVKNGFYYLLGNIGGNTVNAGDDYKVNITGDSYAIEQESAPPTPEYVKIGDFLYKIKKFGSLLWLCEDLRGFGGVYVEATDAYYFTYDDAKNLNNIVGSGWRLPTSDERYSLQTELGDTYGTGIAYDVKSTEWLNGTNASGLNFKIRGYLSGGTLVNYYDAWKSSSFYVNAGGSRQGIYLTQNFGQDANIGNAAGGDGGDLCNVRLVHDA